MATEDEKSIPQDVRDFKAPIEEEVGEAPDWSQALTPDGIRDKEKQRMVKFALVHVDSLESEHQNDPKRKAKIAQEWLQDLLLYYRKRHQEQSMDAPQQGKPGQKECDVKGCIAFY